jgi:hypothetical protein
MPVEDHILCRLFHSLDWRKSGGDGSLFQWNKYNPLYNLKTMKPRREMDKVGLRKT